MTPPQGIPPALWLVIKPSGERHYLEKEPLEGIAAWAKGLNVQVIEYRFSKIAHSPPAKFLTKTKE